MVWLKLPYLLNILILVPVCLGMFGGQGAKTVFEGRIGAERGLELLVGSLWLAILAGSVAGLVLPRTFAPLLAIQVFYKAIWLVAFVLPLARNQGLSAVPAGITSCFILIVATWPVFLWLAFREDVSGRAL